MMSASWYSQSVEMSETPRVEILELKELYIKFEIRGINFPYANALRRIMVAEVPTIALDLVTIRQNTTPVHDEYITHRLGMVPIRSDGTEGFKKYYECTCDNGCEFCNVKFTITCDYDKDYDGNIRLVTADHIKSSNTKFERIKPYIHQALSSAEKMVDVKQDEYENKGIVIMKLLKDHGLNLEAIARKSIGKDHAKWSPAVACNFKYVPKVKVNYEKVKYLSKNEKVNLVKSCPSQVFSLRDMDGTIEVVNANACTFCQECLNYGERILKKPDLVEVDAHQDYFIFELESNGSLKPENIVIDALQILKDKLEVTNSGVKDGAKNLDEGVYDIESKMEDD